jgi:hypothetical protein
LGRDALPIVEGGIGGVKNLNVSCVKEGTCHRPVEIDARQEPRRGFWPRRSAAGRDQVIEELQRGYDEMLALARAMRDHMDGQAQYNRSMLALLERLPDALGSLPETNRHQSRTLEVLQTQLEQQGRQTQKLTDGIASLATVGEHQTQVLGLMQQQIELSSQMEQRRVENLQACSDASVQALDRVCQTHAQSQRRMEELMTRSTRYATAMTAMMLGGGVLTALAVGAATYALMLIAKGG